MTYDSACFSTTRGAETTPVMPEGPALTFYESKEQVAASFDVVLSGLSRAMPRSESAPSTELTPLCWEAMLRPNQTITLNYVSLNGRLHCGMRGVARADTTEAAADSARELARNLASVTTTDAASLHFSPGAIVHPLHPLPDVTWSTHVYPARVGIAPQQPIGFTAYQQVTPTTLVLPYPGTVPESALTVLARDILTHEAALTFRIERVLLTATQRHQINAALRALDSGAAVSHVDSDGHRLQDPVRLAELQREMQHWNEHGSGIRVRCELRANEPLPAPLVAQLGREIYGGRLMDAGQANPLPQDSESLDLGNAYPTGGHLPSLFPSFECLADIGLPVEYGQTPSALPIEGIQLGRIGRGSQTRAVRFAPSDRSRHCYILGATGTGKSTLLSHMVMQDIADGHGVCLLDPHGDLIRDVLANIPPSRAKDVVHIDPADGARAVGINILETGGTSQRIQTNYISNEVISIFSRLYNMAIAGGPVFEQYMRNALLLIMDNDLPGGTLMDIPLIFEDPGFRRHLLAHCRNPYTVSFWQRMAAKAGGDLDLANVGPYITSKLNQFTNNSLLRPIIGQPKSTVDFSHCMESGRIVLVDLPKGLLGELDTRLLGMLVIGKLFAAALARTRLAPQQRKPFYLYVDEAHNFTTDTVASLLAEARKFGLYLTLANQNLAQFSRSGTNDGTRVDMVEAILGNVGTLLLFRLGCHDTQQLQSYVHPELTARDLEDLPDHHAVARLLVQGRPTRPFLFRTMAPYPRSDTPHPVSHTVRRRLNRNRLAFTRPVTDVEVTILNRRKIHVPPAAEE